MMCRYAKIVCCLLLVCGALQGTAYGNIPSELSPSGYPAPDTGCLESGCHSRHAPVRSHTSDMAKQIYLLGAAQGDPNGCVVCHGGDPVALWTKNVHKGAPEDSLLTEFTATPTAFSVVERTCGQCHTGRVYSTMRSGMATGTGHISAALQGWGIKSDVAVGVTTITDIDGSLPSSGTAEYQTYLLSLHRTQQEVFVERAVSLPEIQWNEIEERPELAAYNYVRNECTQCHIGTLHNGSRGSGCAACHMRHNASGSLVVHSIQGTAQSPVVIGDETVSGIPLENCAQCHTEGRKIASAYAGKMRLTGTAKHRMMRDDVHHNGINRRGNPSGGLLCQDCHSTRAMHGTGNIAKSGRVNVEIECADCHGTVRRFPWELPTGWQDEFSTVPASGDARGTADILPFEQQLGMIYPPEQGYLLTARGNPFGNVVRRENAVVVHSASGKSYAVPLLKTIAHRREWKNYSRAVAAMVSNTKHLEELECYSCHSAWIDQEYGRHLLVDYTADGSMRTTHRTEYQQWRNPVLGQNGEGRIAPLTPLLQQDVTLIAPDNALILRRHIFTAHDAQKNPSVIYNVLQKTIEDLLSNKGDTGEEKSVLSVYSSAKAYAEQQVPLKELLAPAFVMAPVAPHTVTRNARPCESCHADSRALGFGDDTGTGVPYTPAAQALFEAAMYSGGDTESLDRSRWHQMKSRRSGHISAPRVPYTQIVARDGTAVQQVGFHWMLSAPVPAAQRKRMEQQNPFARVRSGGNVTEGMTMVIGKYEIDAIAASAAILAAIFFVIVAAFMHTRRCKRKKGPKC